MWDASMSQRKVNISPNLMKVCQYNSRILEFEMICLPSALNVFPSNGQSLMWPNVSGFFLNINQKEQNALCLCRVICCFSKKPRLYEQKPLSPLPSFSVKPVCIRIAQM